jgi:hypothetical protein
MTLVLVIAFAVSLLGLLALAGYHHPYLFICGVFVMIVCVLNMHYLIKTYSNAPIH